MSRKIKIAIDATPAFFRRGGIDTYTYNLINNILDADTSNNYYLYKSFISIFGRRDGYFIKYRSLHRKLNMLQSQTLRLIRSRLPYPSLSKIGGERIDIFHCTDHNYIQLAKTVKKIITVHDLSFLYPENEIVLSKTYIKDMYKSIYSSAMIIAVSEYTKKTIIDHYQVDADKIAVIHEGVDRVKYFKASINDKIANDKILRSLGINNEYILYVGKIEHRKNLTNLIHAYNGLRDNCKVKYDLILVGKMGKRYKEVIAAKYSSKYCENIKIIGFASEDLLPRLYQNATLFVYPSLFEGFGLPPLEALSCGVPTIVHNGTSLPEIVADAGILTDCRDINKLTNSMIAIIENDSKRMQLIEKSLRRSELFAWEKAAQSTIRLYEALVN